MAQLSKNKNYLVFNYSSSPIAVATRDQSYLINGSVDGQPGFIPLTLDEIYFINNNSKAFRNGYLFFEPEFEEDIYNELRIKDWQRILRDDVIEETLLSPSPDSFQRLIDITDPALFERVYGVFMGLKNSGAPVIGPVENALVVRRNELARGKTRSQISVKETAPKMDVESEKKIAALEEQIARLTAMMSEKTAAPVEETVEPAPAKPKTTSNKSRASKGTTKKEE